MRASMGADPGEWDGEDAFEGKPRTVKSLLKKGADPNETDGEKRTALHYAAMVGARTCVSLLLAAGARRDLRDKYRQTPLDLAREST